MHAGTPQNVVKTLGAAYQKTIASTQLRKKLADAGIDAVGGAPETFAAFVQAETLKWRAAIPKRGIKAK